MRVERWCFTNSELLDNKMDGLNSSDEFIAIAHFPEREQLDPSRIIVLRNGLITNRYEDGTVGVSDYEIESAEDEEIYYSIKSTEETSCWLNVEVNEDGRFVRFLEAESYMDMIRKRLR